MFATLRARPSRIQRACPLPERPCPCASTSSCYERAFWPRSGNGPAAPVCPITNARLFRQGGHAAVFGPREGVPFDFDAAGLPRKS